MPIKIHTTEKNMKRLICFLMAALSTAIHAADIEWTVKPNTCSDSDVRNEGRCLYAYTPSNEKLNINGVQFGRWTESQPADFATDASLSDFSYRNVMAGWLGEGKLAVWTGSDAYKAFLNCNWYAGEKERIFTLKGLTPGKRYLVQLWICDGRHKDNVIKKLTLDNKVTGNCVEKGYGSNFVGIFTADAATQDIAFKWENEPNFTGFQVRCLDEAHITWTGGFTSGESDVRTDGDLVYAYKGGPTLKAGDTVFYGQDKSNVASYGSAESPDILFSPALGTLHNASFCVASETVPNGAYLYSENYRELMRGHFLTWGADGISPRNHNRRNITLRNLKPGRRYLVQLWFCDNRAAAYAGRTVVVGYGVELAQNNAVQYGHGSTAIGTFTAVSTEQTFSCFHRVAGETMHQDQEMVGPIQVRCLDDDYEGWVVGDTGADGSVDVRGQPLYAFAGHDTEIAGTLFKAFTGSISDFGDVALKNDGVAFEQTVSGGKDFYWPFLEFDKEPKTPFDFEITPAVSNLLGGGVWNSSDVNQTVELRRLVPGRRYLVQAWFLDTRKVRHGNFAGLTVEYRINNGDAVKSGTVYNYHKAPLGQYVTGVFRAEDVIYSIPFDTKWGQLNAIQVRLLDNVADSYIKWECAETKAGYESVSKEGEKHCAYAPWSFEADGVQFDEAFDEGVLGNNPGNGDVVFRRPLRQRTASYVEGEAEPLFKNGWFNYNDGNSSGTNTVTLGNLKPGCKYLVQLFVADLRNNPDLNKRWMSIDGKKGYYGPTGGKFQYGTVFTGRFTADATTISFEMSTASSGTAQLNAIQVRELGPQGPTAVKAATAQDWKWTTGGEGWEIGGADQSEEVLWDDAAGNSLSAFVAGNAVLPLGSDITVGAVYSTGDIVIGESGTEYKISVKGEIVAPMATVNAIWRDFDVRKTTPGITVLSGPCPNLESVFASGGKIVLDGTCPNELDITVCGAGVLGFSTVRALGVKSLNGDGTLSGPGGILLSGGKTLSLPAELKYDGAFSWNLENGSSLRLAENGNAALLTVNLPSPKAYVGKAAVYAGSPEAGKPTFVLGERDYRAVWSETLSAWTVEPTGLKIIIR